MKNNKYLEGGVITFFILILILFLNPFQFWMPGKIVMTLLCILVLVSLLLGAFIWNEKAQDEREMFHRMIAGRVAFLVGAGILVLGIVIQEYTHSLDPWLVYSLGVMILGKSITQWFFKNYR